MQEGVEEVDGEEAQVRQALQQALHAGVADLWHFAGVEGLTEADVHVVFMEPGVRPHGERRVRKKVRRLEALFVLKPVRLMGTIFSGGLIHIRWIRVFAAAGRGSW